MIGSKGATRFIQRPIGQLTIPGATEFKVQDLTSHQNMIQLLLGKRERFFNNGQQFQQWPPGPDDFTTEDSSTLIRLQKIEWKKILR